MQQNVQRGFSLLELVVVLLIVGLLTRIAWPDPRQHQLKTQQLPAQNQFLALQLAQEQWRFTHGHYDSLQALGWVADDQHYQYSVQELAADDYVLVAQRVVREDATQSESQCQVLRLSAAGDKQPAACW